MLGIDVHKKVCQVAILNEEGDLLEETRFSNTLEGIDEFAEKLSATREDIYAILESTGNLWVQIHERLEKQGVNVSLSSPSNSRLISDSRLKTDITDARALARLHRAGVLSTCYVPSIEERSLRERNALVGLRN